jgi:hypothetical protein
MNQKEIVLLIFGGLLATTIFFSMGSEDSMFQFNKFYAPRDTTQISGNWQGGKTRSKTKQNRTRRK